jgi:hypothetical protein
MARADRGVGDRAEGAMKKSHQTDFNERMACGIHDTLQDPPIYA